MFKRLSPLVAVVCALALLTPLAASAQEEQRFEAFGSFSYLFADVGGGGGGRGAGLADVSGVGFNGEFAFFLNDWLGLGAEVGYNSGELDLPVIAIFPTPEISFSQWTVLFGPRFRLAQSERFRVGAQVMAGIARGSADIEFGMEEFIIRVPGRRPERFPRRAFSFDETVFAVTFGVHFDLKLNDRLVWRVVQPDVLITGFGNESQANFRISTGLGFDF